jgi:hypothetical protein
LTAIFGRKKVELMHYSRPIILRTDNAISAIQSLNLPSSAKPVGDIVENAGTKFTTVNAYEVDE